MPLIYYLYTSNNDNTDDPTPTHLSIFRRERTLITQVIDSMAIYKIIRVSLIGQFLLCNIFSIIIKKSSFKSSMYSAQYNSNIFE